MNSCHFKYTIWSLFRSTSWISRRSTNRKFFISWTLFKMIKLVFFLRKDVLLFFFKLTCPATRQIREDDIFSFEASLPFALSALACNTGSQTSDQEAATNREARLRTVRTIVDKQTNKQKIQLMTLKIAIKFKFTILWWRCTTSQHACCEWQHSCGDWCWSIV